MYRNLQFLGSLITVFGAYAAPAHALPDRMWGTYYNDSEEDVASGASFNGGFEVVTVGWTGSTTSIATVGSHDTSHNGSLDGFVTMFDQSGGRAFGTYYGGSGQDWFEDVVHNDLDQFYALGSTQSTSGIHTAGAHQTALSGIEDAMLVKFDYGGARLWGTYFGGNALDQGYGVCIAETGTVYIVGATESTDGLAINALHDSTKTGTFYNGFIAKVTSSGTVLWATYYGGSRTIARACKVDASNNIYVTGDSFDNADIAVGGHDNSYNGDSDAFLAKFNTNGALQWATYYGGSNQDESHGVDLDSSGNVYIAGLTKSASGIATFGAALNDGMDAFVAKFNSSGTRQWGRYFGGSDASVNSNVDLFTDLEIFGSTLNLSGATTSTNNIATIDAFDSTKGGGGDAMFVTMSTAGAVNYGTYNGGDDNDKAWNVAVTLGDVVIVGQTTSTNGIATVGAHDTSGAGPTNLDAFITYIRMFAI